MSQYSQPNIKFVGSHAGVSIGVDGASQMALEDLASFRAIHGMTVFYPSDAISTAKLTQITAATFGNFYLRLTRGDLPFVYNENEEFEIGGSKTLKSSENDLVTVFAAGVTLHEALKAHLELLKEGVNIRVVDLYSIKPLDLEVISKASQQTKAIIVVEDHYQEGGIYEAVCGSGKVLVPTFSLSVNKIPHSGTPEELLKYEEIDALAIVEKVKNIIKTFSL
jgi:transketolase